MIIRFILLILSILLTSGCVSDMDRYLRDHGYQKEKDKPFLYPTVNGE